MRDHHRFSSLTLSFSTTHLHTNILAVYSIPNIVLPFFAGYLVDRIGAPRISVVLTIVLVLGHLILSLGVSSKSTVLVIVGRTIFGFGGEGLQVAQAAIISYHFKGNELAFAMGVQLSIARAGSVLAFNIAPSLASTYTILTPLYLGVALCGAGVLAAMLLIPFDVRHDTEKISTSSSSSEGKKNIQPHQQQNPIRADILGCHVDPYTIAFWLVTLNCVMTYGVVYPFNSIGSPFLIRKFLCAPKGHCCPRNEPQCPARLEAETHAGQLLGVPIAMSGILAPFIGALSDVVGLKAIFVLISALLMMGSHIYLSAASPGSDPLGALVLMGTGFSIYGSVLWPCIPFLVVEEQVGVAFGLINCLQNMGLALYPMIIVALRAHSGSYDDIEVFFLSLALISTLSAIALIVLDMMKLKGRLNGDFFCVSVRDDDDDDKKKKKEKTERRVGVKGSLNRDPENDEDESTPFLKQGGEDNGLRRRGGGGDDNGFVGDEV